MNERSRVLAATVAGATLGGLIGYLYFTTAGRRFREQVEPWLDECSRELGRIRATVQKAQAVADEGRRTLTEVLGDRPRAEAWNSHARQSAPF